MSRIVSSFNYSLRCNCQVERLVDRVNNSTLLEDRRDACRALKAMSRKYRVEVGAQGMDTLKQVLSAVYSILLLLP